MIPNPSEQGPFLNPDYISYRLFEFFDHWQFPQFGGFVERAIPLLFFLSALITIVFVFCLFFVALQISRLDRREREKFVGPTKKTEAEILENRRWQRVEEHLNAASPSEWRLAVLEADIILGEMLDKMGYPGATIGDKLKNVEQSDFETLDAAWEAHKIRNQIAHEGADFSLSQREAGRVIDLYKKVFKEFKFI
ncbi:MAG: hypothetical protein HYT43_00890 [Candidatus Taylorbacteria bacterium]|nr:hypothetical protein [Candidatus Taylorbacteria bacterium]